MEIPACIVPVPFLSMWGRRPTTAICYFLTGAFAIAIAVTPPGTFFLKEKYISLWESSKKYFQVRLYPWFSSRRIWNAADRVYNGWEVFHCCSLQRDLPRHRGRYLFVHSSSLAIILKRTTCTFTHANSLLFSSLPHPHPFNWTICGNNNGTFWEHCGPLCGRSTGRSIICDNTTTEIYQNQWDNFTCFYFLQTTVYPDLPCAIFGVVSIFGAGVALMLPEMKDMEMMDQVSELELEKL